MTLYVVTGSELNGLTHGDIRTRTGLRKFIKNRTLKDNDLCKLLDSVVLKDKRNHVSFDADISLRTPAPEHGRFRDDNDYEMIEFPTPTPEAEL